MPIVEQTLPTGAQVPTEGANLGGGLIVAIYIPTGAAGTTYDLEYSPDGGTTWDPIYVGTTQSQITYVAGGHITNFATPLRAPLFRINSDTNETSDIVCEIHTV